MKKILLLVWLLFVAPLAHAGMSLSPGMVAHTHADANTGGGTLALSGSLSSTKAGAAGYTRKNPNFLVKDNIAAPTALTRDTCIALAAPDAGALMVRVFITVQVKSANAIALRNTDVGFYSDAGCATVLDDGTGGGVSTQEREFAAVAAGTIILVVNYVYNIPLPSGGATIYFKMADDIGNQGVANLYLLGYHD